LSFAKHLDKVTLKNLMDYEYESTAYSLTTLDRPNYTIRIKCVDEENVGKLIMFMEMLTAYMGEMMGVNTYDQPGVELSKKFTKGCLGVKGYEEHAKNLKEYKKNIIKFSL